MKEIILARDARLALRSQAHHLDPVVLLGANGLTNAVLHEIDRALNDHELIKVRVPSDDREELESIYAEVAEKLGAARVQMIGKLLIFWRPADESERQDPDEAARLAILSMKTASVAGKKEAPSAPAQGRREARQEGRLQEAGRKEEGHLPDSRPLPFQEEPCDEEGCGLPLLISLT